MKVYPLQLKGVYVIEPEPREDHRGFFMRCYDRMVLEPLGIHRDWVQENHSRTVHKGTIRGLHFQYPPHAETKLIRVVNGAIMDIFVDLRRGSPSFGEWGSIELSAENRRLVLIPKGFAHGFCTLTNNCDVIYKVDEPYAPNMEGGIRWDDPELKILWPTADPLLSEKDRSQLSLEAFRQLQGGLNVT